MKEERKNTSPCPASRRVRDPQNCNNKRCRDWQGGFIDRWEAMRRSIRLKMENAAMNEEGVQVGGNLYSHPDRVREYTEVSTYDGWLCPKDLCTTPCAVCKAWDDAKGGEQD